MGSPAGSQSHRDKSPVPPFVLVWFLFSWRNKANQPEGSVGLYLYYPMGEGSHVPLPVGTRRAPSAAPLRDARHAAPNRVPLGFREVPFRGGSRVGTLFPSPSRAAQPPCSSSSPASGSRRSNFTQIQKQGRSRSVPGTLTRASRQSLTICRWFQPNERGETPGAVL